MARSSGMRVDWMSTSALAPGYATVIWTCGGAISGNWETGRVPIASSPSRTIRIDTTIARTGRWRIFANLSVPSFRVVLQLREHLGGVLELHLDLRAVLEGVSTFALQLADEKGLRLTQEIDARVPRYLVGDPLRLTQILTNLAMNSLTHAFKENEGGKINLVAELKGETVKNNKIHEAKEKYLKLKSEFEEEVNKKKNIIIQNENKVKQRRKH